MLSLCLLQLSLFTLSAWETPWSNSSSDSADLNTPWGAQISEERKDARENFFRDLNGDSAAVEAPRVRDEQSRKMGIPVGDQDSEGSEALSQLPWGQFESKAPETTFTRVLVWPVVEGRISSGFGVRGSGFHEGVDIRAPEGTAVRAAASGRVVFSGNISGYGRTIVIYHGDGVSTVYAHNSKNIREAGDKVLQGQLIGYVGQTGRATGSHMHFEVRRGGRPVNPLSYNYSRHPLLAAQTKTQIDN